MLVQTFENKIQVMTNSTMIISLECMFIESDEPNQDQVMFFQSFYRMDLKFGFEVQVWSLFDYSILGNSLSHL